MRTSNFNPRSPWGERLQPDEVRYKEDIFQSTLPVGGATHVAIRKMAYSGISIHAPRGGSDATRLYARERSETFQSTLPVGGATREIEILRLKGEFQSTLPVGGATIQLNRQHRHRVDFNPRSPWGERQQRLNRITAKREISIHAPRGGSDYRQSGAMSFTAISIHAPRGGSDFRTIHLALKTRNFNPRSPWGERQQNVTKV